jgi:hypothetical protein
MTTAQSNTLTQILDASTRACLQLDIDSVTIHPHSGDATVESNRKTLFMIHPDGRTIYWAAGSPAAIARIMGTAA